MDRETLQNLFGLLQKQKPLASNQKALRFMIANFSRDVRLEEIAAAAGISKFNLCRNFQRRYNLPPIKWLWIFRTLVAAEFIEAAPSFSLTDIAFSCGFSSSAHFSRCFSEHIGVSPSQYRKLKNASKLSDETNHSQEFFQLYHRNQELLENAFVKMILNTSFTPRSES